MYWVLRNNIVRNPKFFSLQNNVRQVCTILKELKM